MCEVLTKSGLSFMVKMIQEIISMSRTHLGYPHNFMVNSWVFKNDESESDAKTNSRHRVCLLLVGSPLLAWRVHSQSLLLAHYVNTFPLTSTCDKANRNEHVRCPFARNFLPFSKFPGNSLFLGKNRRETRGCHMRARMSKHSRIRPCLQISRNNEFGLNRCLHIRTHLFSIRPKYPLTFVHLHLPIERWQTTNRYDRTHSFMLVATSTLGECTCLIVFGHTHLLSVYAALVLKIRNSNSEFFD